ncbi:MAG: DUF5050 domain-containing protein [Clostridia bacterium]|nr:DUF5050 domain-containing protein [Clostridia bacterium]
MLIDLLCPVENQGVVVKTNSKTGMPYAVFKLFNLSDRVVQRVVFTLFAYDTYGNQLGSLPIDLSELNGEPKSFFATNKAVSLEDFSEAKHITVEFSEVHFSEGEPYVADQNNLLEIAVTEPDSDEKIRLINAAGEDAVCYAKDAATHWLCVCGRPNANEADECVRCGREKEDVLANYSSRDAITKTLATLYEERLKAEEEERLQLAKEKEERIAKRKKVALISAISLLATAILCVIIFWTYIALVIHQGNKAAESGNYMKAYTMYVKAGKSRRVAEISEKLRGNSNMNLRSMGIMTTDDENIYYIDPTYCIYKEDKQTGEKTRLGDATGMMLNAMDGWVYYKDITTGNLCRISEDGETKEILVETTDDILNLTVVGNEVYYILNQAIKNMTPEMQEQIAAGEMAGSEFRLYRLTIGTKKPKLVFNEDIKDLVYYKDRFYYLNDLDGGLYSFDRHGADLKKVANGPLYGFEAVNDSLYYIDGTVDESTGIPALSLIRADINGNYIEDVVNDKLVVNFMVDGEDVYYAAVNLEDGKSALYKKSGEETVLVSENCEISNVRDGYILYVNSDGQLMKTKADKSGFEELELNLPEVVQ